MGGEPRTDAPPMNRDPAEVERKLSLLYAPHVELLAAAVGDGRAVVVRERSAPRSGASQKVAAAKPIERAPQSID